MNFVAIEFGEKSNGTYTLGYLRIPMDFNPKWYLGFREYIIDKYKREPKIYPLHVHQNVNTMTIAPAGYKNMSADFVEALRSLKYYPKSEDNDNIRRAWAKLDLRSSAFTNKNQ